MSGTTLKSLIRRTARRCGLDLRRYNPQNSEWASLARMLAHHGISTVLDIGANTGQYATGLREAGFRGRIISFEPLKAIYEQLLESARSDPLWTIAPRTALGAEEGSVEINVAGNGGASSSVLPMLQAHLAAAPDSAYVAAETVPLTKLDSIYPRLVSTSEITFLKIDVQGFEWEVLRGAKGVLPFIQGVQIELSLLPLYEGQVLFGPVMDHLLDGGFRLWHILPGLVDTQTGRLMQMDGVFFRPPLVR